jgi:hypothetical protein
LTSRGEYETIPSSETELARPEKRITKMADETAVATPGLNEYGINTDPKLAVEQVAKKELVITEDTGDKVPAGKVIETFTITVKGKVKEMVENSEGKAIEVETEKIFYSAENQPFGWTKLAAFPEIFSSEGAELSDAQVEMLPKVFSGEGQGKLLISLKNLWNDNERAKAKANEYARIMGIFKPTSDEDRAKAKDNMVKNYAKGFNVSLDEARRILTEKGFFD